jgi:hypothetical protein
MKLSPPLAALAALATLLHAAARDNGQWNDQPPEIRQWFQSVMQPDNPYMSCCGEADAFDVGGSGTIGQEANTNSATAGIAINHGGANTALPIMPPAIVLPYILRII